MTIEETRTAELGAKGKLTEKRESKVPASSH
jgi:hypothetical protein